MCYQRGLRVVYVRLRTAQPRVCIQPQTVTIVDTVALCSSHFIERRRLLLGYLGTYILFLQLNSKNVEASALSLSESLIS